MTVRLHPLHHKSPGLGQSLIWADVRGHRGSNRWKPYGPAVPRTHPLSSDGKADLHVYYLTLPTVVECERWPMRLTSLPRCGKSSPYILPMTDGISVTLTFSRIAMAGVSFMLTIRIDGMMLERRNVNRKKGQGSLKVPFNYMASYGNDW